MIRAFAVVCALALSACSLSPSSLDKLSSGGSGSGNADASVEGAAGGADAGQGSGGAGGGACFPTNDQKVCAGNCVSRSDPAVGCNSSSCSPCTLPNAVADCGPAGCAIKSCNPGYADCNNDPADGCETNVSADPTNCGSCAHDCAAGGGTTNFSCDQGTCVVNSCPAGKADCNGDKSCSTDLMTSVDNCGFCGNQCALPHAKATCSAGSCTFDSCEPGFLDCDGDASNGCEVDATTDVLNCGGCGQKCSATNGVPSCSGGQCNILCMDGYGNCDGDAKNGCETNTSSSVSNCGKCGVKCSTNHATPSCSGGACQLSCASGYKDCNGKPADGCETDVQTDSLNCGGCGRTCPPAYYCALGVCRCMAALPCPT